MKKKHWSFYFFIEFPHIFYSKLCGFTICCDCSQKRIKEKRACDLCVWRLANKQSEDLKAEYLINYEEAIKELEIELQTMEAKIDELKNLTLSLNTEVFFFS